MAMSWEEFTSAAYRSNALSFFAGLDGYEQSPIVMLAGDRNITGGVSDRCGSVSGPPGVRAREYRAGNKLSPLDQCRAWFERRYCADRWQCSARRRTDVAGNSGCELSRAD